MTRKRRRTTSIEPESAGHDSFLDVVSNMVGILIILVVVAGLRVRDLPLVTKNDEAKIQSVSSTLEKKQQTFQQNYEDCLTLSKQVETMQYQQQLRENEQQRFVSYYAQLENMLRSHTETLDQSAKQQLYTQRELAEIEAKLNELQQHKNWLNSPQKTEQLVVENLPTPITTDAGENEIHFRLIHGRIAYVPLTQLLDQLKAEILRRQDVFLHQPRMAGILGPVADFRMQYSVARHDMPVTGNDYEAGMRSIVMLEGCVMLPDGNDEQLGETIADAIKTTSQFRNRIMTKRQDQCTVTIWVYPDSFKEFQMLKNYLHRSGYRFGVRPLDFGIPITVSPHGTKSSAQ